MALKRRHVEEEREGEHIQEEKPLSESSDLSESESDTVEDEDGELVTPAIDAQILRTLAEIRAGNTKIYNPEVKFFDEEEIKRAEEEWMQKKKAEGKKVTLTDYQRERLLSGKLDEEGSEVEDLEEKVPLTHYEEQEQLKNAFKIAFEEDKVENDDEEEDIFRVRPKTDEQLQREEEDYRAFLLENLSRSENARESMGEWLNYKNDPSAVADPEEKFLIEYVLGRGWIDHEKKTVPDYEKIIKADEEDMDAVERAEEFETEMNFRFEQPGADQVITYSRNIEGSMRREDSKRKAQREAKQMRKEEQAKKITEDIKRKKNKTKSEILKKLSKIQKIAGLDEKEIEELDDAFDLDVSDFDLDEHDKKMAALFDNSFYDADDTEKPAFTSDDEQYDEVHDEEEASIDHAEYEPDASESDDEFKVKIVEKKQKAISQISKLKDELYKLDVEDVIGTNPEDAVACRFRYTSVLPASFGLESKEILEADEKLLNSHVSLKKLAPYRPVEKQKHDIKKLGDRRRVYMLRKQMWDAKKAEREARKHK